MRVLVTGATGFAGQAVVSALADAGHTVVAGVRHGAVGPAKAARFVMMPDLAAPFDARFVVDDAEAVVHMAGLAHSSSSIPEAKYDAINAHAALVLATASRNAGVKRFVFVSSVRAQTGPSAEGVVTEDRVAKPTDSYGRSKLKGEAAARDVLAGTETRLVVLRPVLMYGPKPKGNMATLVRLARSGLPLPLADLQARRSLLGVDNLADAVRHVLLAPEAAGQTFLVADDEPLPVGEIVAALRSGLERPAHIFSLPLPGAEAVLRLAGKSDLAARLYGDLIVSTEALRATGWQAPAAVRDGLASLLSSSPSSVPAAPAGQPGTLRLIGRSALTGEAVLPISPP